METTITENHRGSPFTINTTKYSSIYYCFYEIVNAYMVQCIGYSSRWVVDGRAGGTTTTMALAPWW